MGFDFGAQKKNTQRDETRGEKRMCKCNKQIYTQTQIQIKHILFTQTLWFEIQKCPIFAIYLDILLARARACVCVCFPHVIDR